jgi:hypothetical protein
MLSMGKQALGSQNNASSNPNHETSNLRTSNDQASTAENREPNTKTQAKRIDNTPKTHDARYTTSETKKPKLFHVLIVFVSDRT